ncbi:MAG: radical SAM protein [Elusimicrobia bacterium]|nr:radical SAM protein [Elusimicrobiota bacterium]
MTASTLQKTSLAPGVAGTLAFLDKIRLKGPANDGLAELHIELTHACNLKCPMCHHWRMKNPPPGKMLDAKSLARMLDGTKKLDGIKAATLTGGEPFLREDFAEIALLLHKRFPKASLGALSNFQSPELVLRRLRQLRGAGIKMFWLGSSLDGIGPGHDAMRGVKGAYANLLKTTALLKQEFPDINFGFNYTLTPENTDGLFETYLAMASRGLWLGAQLVVNQENLPAKEYACTDAARTAAAAQIERVLTHICFAERAYELINSGRSAEKPWLWTQLAYWHNLRQYALKPRRLFETCGAGRRYAMLAPDGSLFFCPVKKHLMAGNAAEAGFDAAWNSPQARSIRKTLSSKKCHCWLHCIANPVLEQAAGALK